MCPKRQLAVESDGVSTHMELLQEYEIRPLALVHGENTMLLA